MIKSPAELEQRRQEILSKRNGEKARVSICAGAGCLATGAGKVIDATGAMMLTGSNNRLAAKQPGRRGGGLGRKPAEPRRAQREP